MASRGIAAFFAHAQGEHADCVLYYYTDSPADCKGESLKNRKKSKRGRSPSAALFLPAIPPLYRRRIRSQTGTITQSGSTQLIRRSALATIPGEQTHRLSRLARSASRTMYFACPAK